MAILALMAGCWAGCQLEPGVGVKLPISRTGPIQMYYVLFQRLIPALQSSKLNFLSSNHGMQLFYHSKLSGEMESPKRSLASTRRMRC